MNRGLLGGLTAIALTLVFASSASAFDAKGSVEQVYATGLTPGAQVSLTNSGGQVVETKTANSLGGTLFRTVTPGGGYTVSSNGETSGPLTVLPEQSAPPSTDVYDQEVPNDGYGYLTTRDGIKLAYSVHPPTDVKNALDPQADDSNPPADPAPSPTLIEYSGYGYARPAGPVSGISALANLDGLHGRRRQHARHRLLGRGIRLLRAASDPRRLRHHRDRRPPAVGRPQQGRDDRHLLRRHQPALHRPDAAARAWRRSRRCR